MKKSSLYQLLVSIYMGFIACASLWSQAKMTSETRFIIQEVITEFKSSQGNSPRWGEMLNTYPLYQQNGLYVLSFLAKKNLFFDESTFISRGVTIGSTMGDILTLRVPVQGLSEFILLSGLDYMEVAGKVSANLDKVLFDTRVDSVHKGINLPDIFTGKDVLIGITDWGFDYTSPMFYDTLLTQTRILAAWDQFKTSGPSPSGYTYGAEYTGDANLIFAETDTSNFYGHHTHGTHVAGIAGGSGAGTNYRGVAFESEFLMVTIRLDQASVLDAFDWMKQKADAEGKRLVINMSWGLYYFGTLDGNSLTSQAIDYLSSQGVVFCNSAGNNGNVNFHIKHDFAMDTLKSRIGFYTYSDPNMRGQSVNMWGEPYHNFQSRIRFLDGSNVLVGETPMFNTAVDTNFIDSIVVIGADTIWYKLGADASHPLNQRPHMRFRVNNKTSYKSILVSTADSGTVHYWNITELDWGEGNWGQAFYSIGTGYTAGDHFYGLSEPSVTNSLISVASHNAEYRNGLGNIVGGTFSSFSSNGPTIDGRMKPDICAPGGNVCSSISSFTDAAYTPVTTVSFSSRTYPFAKFSGTSMSSPAAAGVAALILDANPFLTPQEIKDILILTAREDAITGDIPDSGSTKWGHGKLNAYYAIALALNIVNINTYKEQEILAFPNPAVDQLFLISDKFQSLNYTMNIFSIDGKLIRTGIFQPDVCIDVSTLTNGMYVLRLNNGSDSYHCRFIKTGE